MQRLAFYSTCSVLHGNVVSHMHRIKCMSVACAIPMAMSPILYCVSLRTYYGKHKVRLIIGSCVGSGIHSYSAFGYI